MAPRVWDSYLSDQDRLHAAGHPARRSGAGTAPALLLVDLYRGVFGDRPEPLLDAVKTWPASCGLAGWAALPAIQTLLAAARESAVPVVHVTGLEGIPHWRQRAGESAVDVDSPPAQTAGAAERQRRQFEIVHEVSPMPGEVVIRKAAPSAFWGTPLPGYLNQIGVDTLIVSGETTSGCVRATVVDGSSYRYNMLVVEECVFDRHEAAHAINLFDMDQKYADVIALADAVRYVRGHAPVSPSPVAV